MSSEQLRNELEEKRRRIEQIKMARLQQQQNSTLVANSSMSCASPSGIHRSPSFADSSGATNFSHAPILTSALSNLSRSSSFVSYANPQAAASPTTAGLGAHPATKYPSLSGSVTSPRRAPLTGAGSMSSPTARTSDYTPSFPSSSGVTNVTMPTISSNVTQVNPTASTTRPAWTPGGANTTTAPTRPPTLHNPQLSMTTYLTVADVHAKAPPERYEKEIQVEEAVISLHTGITSDANAVSTGGGFLLAPTSAMEDSRSSSVFGPSVSVPDTPDLERVPSIMDDEAKARAAFLAEQQSQQRREQLLSRPDLDSFLSKSSLVMERALILNRDMFLERAAGIYDGDIVRHRGLGALQRTSHCFEDEATHNCAVTALSFQPSSSVEFFCASYRDLTKGFNATDEGFILGWSLHVRKPAFRLSTPSELSNMQYCEYRPHLIIGGTYSGQVILWDTRKGTSPVVVTAVMKENHTNPIFGINLVGTMSNHQLITTSNDGRMCTWNLDKMTAPVERTNLQVKEEVGDTAINKSITCTSVDFSHQDSEKFFVGGENGVMYSASRHSTQSYLNKVEGHTSPITSISCHPMNSSTGEDAEMGNLVLSSSLDWTVNLWYEDRSTLTLVGSFTDYLDYVYDVQWSPVNPSMFATGDGNGAVTLWNLARSWASPAGRYFINNDESQHLGTQSAHAHHQGTTHAVNRISWSPDGAFLAVGDSSGSISLLTVMDHMPMDDDAQKLRTNVMSAHRAATRK